MCNIKSIKGFIEDMNVFFGESLFSNFLAHFVIYRLEKIHEEEKELYKNAIKNVKLSYTEFENQCIKVESVGVVTEIMNHKFFRLINAEIKVKIPLRLSLLNELNWEKTKEVEETVDSDVVLKRITYEFHDMEVIVSLLTDGIDADVFSISLSKKVSSVNQTTSISSNSK